jgi:hypothetical protein
MKKFILTVLLCILMCLLCSCGTETKETYNEVCINNRVENPEEIKNGEYTVLDVREQNNHSPNSSSFYVTLVLQGKNGNRCYYEYYCMHNKDSYYVSLAKLIAGDTVTCKNGKLEYK